MNLIGSLEHIIKELNAYSEQRLPGCGVQWKASPLIRYFTLYVNGTLMGELEGVTYTKCELWETRASYDMDNEGSAAENALNVLENWLEQTPMEDTPKYLSTGYEPLARLLLEGTYKKKGGNQNDLGEAILT